MKPYVFTPTQKKNFSFIVSLMCLSRNSSGAHPASLLFRRSILLSVSPCQVGSIKKSLACACVATVDLVGVARRIRQSLLRPTAARLLARTT